MTVHRVLVQACMAACLLWIPSHAQATNPDTGQCAAADARLAAKGTGDSDHDGLSDCRERKISGTLPRDFDSDDDGLADGVEDANHNGVVDSGETDPTLADSDDDGLSDGVEDAVGSDPNDRDSDDDGILDGDKNGPDTEDQDPNNDLDSEIRGMIDSLTCEAPASIVVLGITIAIDDQTRYEGPQGCASLKAAIDANGGAHAQVEVREGGGLVAEKISVDDADNDGSPNHVDADDDNNGNPDVTDTDDDGNGVPDVEDSGHHSEDSGHS